MNKELTVYIYTPDKGSVQVLLPMQRPNHIIVNYLHFLSLLPAIFYNDS